MENDDDDFKIDFNDLTDSLQKSFQTIKEADKERKSSDDELKKENLEDFILKYAGRLVKDGVEFVEDLKTTFSQSLDPREIESLAETFKGVSGALNILKDIQVSKEKSKTSKELKTMEIEAKKERIEDKEIKGLRINRDELFKRLLNDANVIDVEFQMLSASEPKQ
jgi:viroplasmin and RNaseH domain-containing protein